MNTNQKRSCSRKKQDKVLADSQGVKLGTRLTGDAILGWNKGKVLV